MKSAFELPIFHRLNEEQRVASSQQFLPDPIIYHYTNMDGFLGIAESRRIRATHYGFLNDPTELTYAVEVMRAVSDSHPSVDARERAAVKDSYITLDHLLEASVFTASFSSLEDELSQWINYARPSSGGGVRIAFRRSDIESNAVTAGCMLVPCIYDVEEQANLAKQWIAEMRDVKSLQTGVDRQSFDRAVSFVKLACRFKSPAFLSEKEWRVVKILENPRDKSISYRVRGSTLVPYINAFSLTPSPKQSFRAYGLKVGPSADQELALRSISHYLLSTDAYVDGGVTKSSIPFRVV